MKHDTTQSNCLSKTQKRRCGYTLLIKDTIHAARAPQGKEHKPARGASAALASVSNALALVLSRVFLKAFTLTFVAEWGDRSQIATIGCV